jgi:uncharacterized cupredoxin-like copper-binding protein
MAQDPAVRQVEVRLTSFSYAPNVIELIAGESIRLVLINPGSGAHDFGARAFFAAAEVAAEGRGPGPAGVGGAR